MDYYSLGRPDHDEPQGKGSICQGGSPSTSLSSQPHLLPQYMVFSGDLIIDSPNPVIRNTVIVAGSLTCSYRLKVTGQLVVLANSEWLALREYLTDSRIGAGPTRTSSKFRNVAQLPPVGRTIQETLEDKQIYRVQDSPLLIRGTFSCPVPLQIRSMLAIFSHRPKRVQVCGLMIQAALRRNARRMREEAYWSLQELGALGNVIRQTVSDVALTADAYRYHLERGVVIARDMTEAARGIEDFNRHQTEAADTQQVAKALEAMHAGGDESLLTTPLENLEQSSDFQEFDDQDIDPAVIASASQADTAANKHGIATPNPSRGRSLKRRMESGQGADQTTGKRSKG